ncbi:methyltransferase domain-containing protein [Sinorhizobium meliloti]|uniref:methyltransferase domain-containing protein n=1 Tax=Rhizobium meliloti TaxID=382 RepID=UPI00398D4EDF
MKNNTQSFDPGAYWEGRHKEFLNDNRNVGERGLTSTQNYELIAAKAVIVGHILGKLGLQRGADLLDAGCGAGVFTSLLASSGFTMHGADVSRTAIATARATVNASFEIGPLSKRVFGQLFDAVLCLDVLFHVVDDAEWRKSVETLFDSVKPGGFLVIIEYFPAAGAKAATHCRWRSLADYRACLPGAHWVEKFSFTYPYRKEEKTLFVLQRPDAEGKDLATATSLDADKDKRARTLKAAGVRLTADRVPQEPLICEGGPVTIGNAEIGPWNTIGNQSYINSGFVRKAVEIGRYCSIGRNVTIGTGTHDMHALSTSPVLGNTRNIVKYADPERRKSVVIGHDVWIGDNTIVMTGVTVGTGAVIAAGSIVTKDVQPYAVVGGNYAKPVGPMTRFEPEICERLLASKWWELPLDALRTAPHSSPLEFLEWLENVESLFKRKPFLASIRRV